MPEIKQLPPGVINKIAAGEVIERPASVVKELMENSVDAGSTRVDVGVRQGGVEAIRITDDGCGIAADQLPLAVASHATSKIRSADDLFAVSTLGFRGEALASIAEISEFSLRSRPHDAESGAEFEVIGGQIQPVAPCGCPPGTTIEVRNLFYNTPVRRKFLRTTQTEMGHVSEAFQRIALAHPNVHFQLRHNDRTLQELAPVDRWKDRIAALFGAEIAENLIWVEGDDAHVKIYGYVADPQVSRANNRMQYLFLNGRHIRDRALQHALSEAYRGLLMTGRHAVCFLHLQISPETVDVNVHPTKMEVRFQDSGRVYSRLLGMLRNRFLTTDLTARSEPPTSKPPATTYEQQLAQAQGRRDELSDWSRQQFNRAVDPAHRAPASWRQDEFPLSFERGQIDPAALQGSPPQPTDVDLTAGGVAGDAGTTAAGPSTSAASHAIQLHNRYLVTETPEGMIVIDQHALHERILYEQIREKVLAGSLESQRLLTPEPVALTAAEAAAVLDAREMLAKLAIDVEPFGGDTVLVRSYPAILANVRPAELLRQAVELLVDGGQGPQKRDLLDDLLNMVSCKAAIKAGDHLAPEEIDALLERREVCQDAHHCPHGRPTALVFTRDELDKRFKRI
ncbi:MAG: DNA mismatch repair endonuclease MutL [Pirellulaceae bacterium]|jgi:DNA mismatch repair protein MutL|nr:DNA mismatch repair endonuclease MutL [Pirellulaceae bacterium]